MPGSPITLPAELVTAVAVSDMSTEKPVNGSW